MKLKMLGIIIMLVGLAVMACGISVLSGANAGETAVAESAAVYAPELKTGKYYLNGNPQRGCIEICSGEMFRLNDGDEQEYRLREWSDIAETDEVTGKITLSDIYFLGTNLDGGSNFTAKIRFYPENNSLEYNGDYYFLSDNFE